MSRISASHAPVRKRSTRSTIPPCRRLSPRYITNGVAAEEGLGGEHRVGQAARRVLDDVGDADAEAGAVAGRRTDLIAGLRRDDDPDVIDARSRDRLDPVEQHRLVGHRDELLGAGVGDRSQARALAAREDQALHRAAASLRWSQLTRERSTKRMATRLGACFAMLARTSRQLSPSRGSARRAAPARAPRRARGSRSTSTSHSQHHAAQLVVVLAGLDRQRRARVALEVAHLLRRGVGPRPQLVVAHDVPQRHQVRPAVAADRRADHGALLVQERVELGVAHPDLLAAAHPMRAAAASTAARASGGSSTAASPASLSTSRTSQSSPA